MSLLCCVVLLFFLILLHNVPETGLRVKGFPLTVQQIYPVSFLIHPMFT